MQLVLAALVLAGCYPLWLAVRANRQTSLGHALLWACAAWLAWGGALLLESAQVPGFQVARYLALCLTGAAAVAVLGARRPSVGAWNFVLLGLLAVMLLPLAESLFLRAAAPGGLRAIFLVATLAVGVLNYLPTALGPAALLLGVALGGEYWLFLDPAKAEAPWSEPCHVALLLVPWVAWASWRVLRQGKSATEFDRLWREFRDRFGLVWSQRLREQFNRAAANAGWQVHLSWRGVENASAGEGLGSQMLTTLQALLTRFGPADA
jgi:hypothetical protein